MEKVSPAPAAKTMFEVEIAGLPLKVRSSHDEATVRTLIQTVDGKVKEVMEANPNISYQKAIVLVSLHFAEEGLLLKKIIYNELTALETKAKDLLSNLESSPVSRWRLDN
jgi:cell division protein ZapA